MYTSRMLRRNKFRLFSVAIALLLAPAASAAEQGASSAQKRPNILLIIADDMGYSDISPFGAEIRTPNLDNLAKNGVKLTNFHVHTNCSPTRSMLFSGVDNHIAGLGTMQGYQTKNQVGQPGYEGYLNFNVASFASLLQESGYRTYMTGKWHLGMNPEQLPNKRGFEKTYILAEGSANHFDPEVGTLSIIPKPNYREDGVPVTPPKKDFYSTTFYTDRLIEYIQEDKGSNKPFLAVLSYTAPHTPLQAPEKDIQKYDGVYDKGYDAVRQKRLKKQIKLGILPQSVAAADTHPAWPKWDELSADMRQAEIRRMQIYAAMIDVMDAEIGRLLKVLKKTGDLENTVVIFMSDNGPEGNNPIDLRDNVKWVPENFDLSDQNLGKPGSYTSYGPGWASVSATPFRMYKAFPTEGGTRVPAIISYPKHFRKGSIASAFTSVLDIAPTIYELAGVQYPGASSENQNFPKMMGNSLVSYMTDENNAPHSTNYAMGWEMWDRKAIAQGPWKLLAINQPWGEGGETWLLYNTETDPGETTNLAAAMPDKVAELKALWLQFNQNNGVIVPQDFKLRYSNTLSHYKMEQ